MAAEAVLASGDDGDLELKDGLVAQSRRVGEIACHPADSGNEPFVRIHPQRNLVR